MQNRARLKVLSLTRACRSERQTSGRLHSSKGVSYMRRIAPWVVVFIVGGASLVAQDRIHFVPADRVALVVIPAAERDVKMRAMSTTDVAIVEFCPERR
jgi:hypothetical protein